MLRNRQGFTLIELLIVVVIIGILAAIAIPKFGQSREKAYVSAMQSDLRQIMSAQEIYYSIPENEYEYFDSGGEVTGAVEDLNVSLSSGVTVEITADNGAPAGWSAVATHAATDQQCEVYVGGIDPTANADTEGVIWCGEPA